MRALVIDDSKPVRGILAKMLRDFGFETVEAAHGKDGLERLAEMGPVELATVNWQMPTMDGLEFVRQVRASSRFPEMRLLMISGESEPAKMATALAAGADGYIVKPCTRRALSQALGQLGISVEIAGSPTRPCPNASFERPHRIRVLIVDDSVVVRRVVSKVLSADSELEVAGTAADGRLALDKIKSVRPDLVLLDVEMPRLNGIDTLRALRKDHPRLPVIMFSSLTERGAAVTTEALLLGANDYVAKPGGTHMRDVDAGGRAIREELIPKIKQLSLSASGWTDSTGGRPSSAESTPTRGPASRIDVVAMALSTGGPNALAQVLPEFARNCPVPVLIVQHMPPLFTRHLAQRISDMGALDVREGIAEDRLRPGHVRIAPGGYHLTVSRRRDGVYLQLNQDAPVNACRPSADVLFQSVADAYGGAVLAVVMTGMGCDALAGCKCIYRAGGQILAQDEATSVVWGMPGQVVRAKLAEAVLPLDEIGPEIARRLRRQR